MAVGPKVDRRIQRTQQLLRDALMALIVERGYEAITIQDIADFANVSRTTFYLHYRDKEELLVTSMIEMYNEIARNLEPLSREEIEQEGITPRMVAPDDFEHVAAHTDFYRAMLSSKGSAAFVERVLKYLETVCQEGFVKPLALPGQDSHIPEGFIASFIAGGQVGVVRWWLENNLAYSPAQMATMMFYLCAFGAFWALRLNVVPPEEIG